MQAKYEVGQVVNYRSIEKIYGDKPPQMVSRTGKIVEIRISLEGVYYKVGITSDCCQLNVPEKNILDVVLDGERGQLELSL